MHGCAHLYSALAISWDPSLAENVLGFAFDAGPDVQLEHEMPSWNYSGCFVGNGAIEIIPH